MVAGMIYGLMEIGRNRFQGIRKISEKLARSILKKAKKGGR